MLWHGRGTEEPTRCLFAQVEHNHLSEPRPAGLPYNPSACASIPAFVTLVNFILTSHMHLKCCKGPLCITLLVGHDGHDMFCVAAQLGCFLVLVAYDPLPLLRLLVLHNEECF